MCDTEKRQAGSELERIDVTPQMIEAGLTILLSDRFEAEMPATAAERSLVREIFEAMHGQVLSQRSPKGPPNG